MFFTCTSVTNLCGLKPVSDGFCHLQHCSLSVRCRRWVTVYFWLCLDAAANRLASVLSWGHFLSVYRVEFSPEPSDGTNTVCWVPQIVTFHIYYIIDFGDELALLWEFVNFSLSFEKVNWVARFSLPVCWWELWMLMALYKSKVLVWRFPLDAVGCLWRMFLFGPEGNINRLSSIKVLVVGSAVLRKYRKLADFFLVISPWKTFKWNGEQEKDAKNKLAYVGQLNSIC